MSSSSLAAFHSFLVHEHFHEGMGPCAKRVLTFPVAALTVLYTGSVLVFLGASCVYTRNLPPLLDY